MKNLFYIILLLFFALPSFAQSVAIERIENTGNNPEQRTAPRPMTGFKLLEYDPVSKSVKKLPDVQPDRSRQTEIQADNIKEETKKFNFERMKFNGFEN